MNFSRAAAKLLGANVLDAVVAVAALILFARILGAEQLGVFFLFQAGLRLLKIPSGIGIPGAAEKRISAGEPAGEVLSTAFIIMSFSTSFTIVAVFLGRPLIGTYMPPRFIPLLIVGLGIQTLSTLVLHILRGELRAGEVALPKILRRVAWLAVGLVLVRLGFSAFGLASALVIGDTVTLFAGFTIMETRFGKPTVARSRSLVDYARFNFISDIGFFSYNWIDVVVIGILSTPAAVGAYEVAWRISTMVMIAGNSVLSVMFPQVSAWHADNDYDRIEGLLRRTMMAALFLVVPALFGAAVLGTSLLQYVFGPEFTAASVALVVLMAGKILESINSVVGRALQAMNRPNLVARSSIIATGANVVLNPLLIWRFGITGAALATTLSFGIYTLLNHRYISEYLQVRFPLSEAAWMCLGSAGMVGVLLVTASFAQIDGIFMLATHILMGAITYFLIVLAAPWFRRDFLATMGSIRNSG